MKEFFYAHIVDLDDLHSELDILEIVDEEKNQLKLIIESSMHHIVIDTLLSEFPEDHKNTFLEHITADDHDRTWELLNQHILEPERKIVSAVEDLKKELLADISTVKENR